MASAPPDESTITDLPPIEPTHPLLIGKFRAFLVVRLATILGSQGMALIIAWQAYNIARRTMDAPEAAAQLGIIGLIQFIALFAVTPFAGLAADTMSRTRLAQITLTTLSCCTLFLALGSYEGWTSLPMIFCVAVVLGICRAFQAPALSSLAPNLVPKSLLPRAIAFSSMVWQTGAIIGPAIGGFAYSLTPSAAYLASGGLFLTAATCLFIVGKVPQAAPDRKRRPIGQILDGLSYVRENRLVLGAITLDLFAVLLAGTTALLPVYARDILHVDSRGLGMLAAAPGAGALVTALWFSFAPLRHNVGAKMLASVFVFGLATIIFGSTAFLPKGLDMIVAMGAMAMWGSADMFSVFVRSSLIQLHTPDVMRGRVSAVSGLTISASNELGEAESGFLAALIGPVQAVILGGLGAIVITLVWSRLFPELKLARTFDPPDMRTDHPAKENQA